MTAKDKKTDFRPGQGALTQSTASAGTYQRDTERPAAEAESPEGPERHADAKAYAEADAKAHAKVEAYSVALRLMRYSQRSKRTLREALISKGVGKNEAQQTVERLCREGLLNDRLLIYNYCRQLAEKKHFGRIRIKRELYLRFDREDIERYAADALSDIDFEGQAEYLALRYSDKGRDFIIRKLRTQGYEAPQIRAALSWLSALENKE